MAGELATFTDRNWEQDVLRSQLPVLVEFGADWCVPCQTMEPALEAVAREYVGRLQVGKLNVDENAKVAVRYRVAGLPTLLLFKAGAVSAQRVGLMSKGALVKLVELQLA